MADVPAWPLAPPADVDVPPDAIIPPDGDPVIPPDDRVPPDAVVPPSDARAPPLPDVVPPELSDPPELVDPPEPIDPPELVLEPPAETTMPPVPPFGCEFSLLHAATKATTMVLQRHHEPPETSKDLIIRLLRVSLGKMRLNDASICSLGFAACPHRILRENARHRRKLYGNLRDPNDLPHAKVKFLP